MGGRAAREINQMCFILHLHTYGKSYPMSLSTLKSQSECPYKVVTTHISSGPWGDNFQRTKKIVTIIATTPLTRNNLHTLLGQGVLQSKSREIM